MTDESQYKRTSYQRHKAEHRCVACGKVDSRTLDGFVECTSCAAKNRDRHRQLASQNPAEHAADLQFQRERYRRLKAHRCCVACGQSDDRTRSGYARCVACAAKDRERCAVRRAKKREANP